MSNESDPDEEALRWAGDEERGGVAPRRGGPRAAPAALVESGEAELAAERRSPRSAARTAATAVFGVVYLAIVLGWILAVQRTSSGSANLLVEISWQFGEFLAMVSGVLWFGAVHVLTRDRRALEGVGWWALGALVLVPWPLVLVVLAEASS